jgi:hypothetical protein
MAQQINTQERTGATGVGETAEVIPITESAESDPRKNPKAIFIDDTDAWVEKYTEEALFGQLNELY